MNLLIAEDSVMIRERLKDEVGRFEEVKIVGEAENGRDALDMIRSLNPDLVFLDLQMPVMGGIEVLRKMREANMKAKVCILTNYSFPQYKTRCLAIGADYFLSKSEDFDQTRNIIANNLAIFRQ